MIMSLRYRIFPHPSGLRKQTVKNIWEICFFWKSKGFSYRFLKDGYTWKWQLVKDTDVTKALADAADALDTADSKRRVFVLTPQPPYDIGDLWVQGSDGDIMRCQTSRMSGSYSSYDWVKASKYTDDTALNSFINGEFRQQIEALEQQTDKKAENLVSVNGSIIQLEYV